ncbi:MAG TPA: type II toxin-antitoxin system HicB family antitoxin [Pseudolabrys sp.]|jgi:antitoxin HicB|nr:type II toxin-antitoxin system HicB family antitoxin [Pseudolabrys sp.]
MIYLLHVESDDNNADLVTCPAFPEVTTFSERNDEDGACRNALDAIEEAIAARISDGQDIPPSATQTQVARHKGLWVKLPLMTELKVQLYIALRNSDVGTRAELARRMNKPREQIDRLFRLDHASRTDQIESAFHALKKHVELRIR